jgi:ADP-heptose:LPS heptosyltransferase
VEDEGRSLFSVVIERLADLFEPRFCDVYARLFTRVVELLKPEIKAADLLARYERVREVRPCKRRLVRNIFVLSRITLGADIAVTSVVMDALRRRFPEANIHFVGPRKNWELFETDRRISHMAFAYPRSGSLLERLNHWGRFTAPDSIVVDPDSRITQLGILPVCEEADYFFFESRSFGADSNEPLPILASRWTAEVFGVTGKAWISPKPAEMSCDIAVSFGTGGNEEKRVPGLFEEQVLRYLSALGLKVMLDAGAGGPESTRAKDLAFHVPHVSMYEGPFAPFASMIANASLYLGYDSAGGHVAAAAGVPLVSVFAGHPSERMLHRWAPYGTAARRIVKVPADHTAIVLESTKAAISSLLE